MLVVVGCCLLPLAENQRHRSGLYLLLAPAWTVVKSTVHASMVSAISAATTAVAKSLKSVLKLFFLVGKLIGVCSLCWLRWGSWADRMLNSYMKLDVTVTRAKNASVAFVRGVLSSTSRHHQSITSTALKIHEKRSQNKLNLSYREVSINIERARYHFSSRLWSWVTRRTRGCVPMSWDTFIHKIIEWFF